MVVLKEKVIVKNLRVLVNQVLFHIVNTVLGTNVKVLTLICNMKNMVLENRVLNVLVLLLVWVKEQDKINQEVDNNFEKTEITFYFIKV